MHVSKLRIHRYPFIGLLIAMLGAFGVCGATGAVFYVDDDAGLGGDGRSWETSYKYLQDALYDSTLTYGDTIRVAAGIYTPDKDEGGNVTLTDRMATFQLVNGVKLYGGYAGVPGANPDERAPETYVSILSGDLAGNLQNSFHVVTGSTTDLNTILDGFTITAGRANGGYPYNNLGGGMYNRSGSPTVHNCIFQGNQAYWGSGVYNHSNSSATYTYCVFISNPANNGGTIYNENTSNLTVSHCTIADNSNSGIYNVYSHSEIIHCTFTGNSGTAMYNYFSNSRVANCIFSNNSAANGSGMYNYYSSPIVTNCTFSKNTASQYGGGIYNHGGSCPVLSNVILWGNTAPTGAEIYNVDGTCVPAVSFSDVQGGWEGTGNLDLDPLFADLGTGDFHLKSKTGRWNPDTQAWVLDVMTSPCIDAGNPVSKLLEEQIPNGGRINMGAYGGTAQASLSELIVSDNHPADYPDINMQMIINELTAYGSDWKTGEAWPVEPNPIPINFVTRAGYLWKGGELYLYNPQANPPLCWELSTPTSQSQSSNPEGSEQGSATINRYFNPIGYTPESPVQVYIHIEPDASTSVYAVEDEPPAGWTVSAINNSGSWDNVNKKVKWGPFFDNTTRTFNYQAVPPAGETGTKTFSGIYSPNGDLENIILQIDPEIQLLISGYVRTSGGAGISGVTMSGLPGSPTTDGNGYYSATVSSGFSSTVTPSKAGYRFDPATRTYNYVNTDQSAQNYIGILTYTITGKVRTSGGAGISGVTMSGLPGSPTTNSNGDYTATVDSGWSGTVTPSKTGCSFSPPSRSYSNVSSAQSGQDYTGTFETYTISGNAGIGGAVMTGLPGNPVATGDGSYTATVEYGWSGTVTPTLAGYDFSPSSRNYSNITANQTSQDYTATLKTYTISGYVLTSGGTPINGVTMGGLPGSVTTDASGFYTATVDHGWSGTVIPSKTGYSFSPPFLTYSNVTSDWNNQNYIGTPTSSSTYVISGYVRTSGGSGIIGATMGGLPGPPTTDSNGYYSATVDSGWSGTVAPSKTDYTFNPPLITYGSVTSDQSNQNYTGTSTSSSTYIISGYVRTSGGVGISGVTMNGLPGNPTTDGNGYYSAIVDSGWSNTVSPSKADYTFDPPSRNYNNVTANWSDQNYIGTSTSSSTYVISGNVWTSGGVGISGVTMNGLPGNPTTDGSGYYHATVESGWTGSVEPSKAGYIFGPASIDYPDVTSNQSHQNYTAVLQGSTIFYVPSEYTTIQAAIDAALDGDLVIVADGTYSGDGNRDLDLWGKSITVKSNNNGPDTCIIDCGGTEEESHRGFYIHSEEDPNSIVEGFTIINGYTGLDGGGGIYCENSSPTIRSCYLRDNATEGNGGGISCIQANPVIERCTISGNTAGRGGGVYARESDIALDKCTLEENWASSVSSSGQGGAIYIEDNSNLTVSVSKLIANSADSSGGGIYCEDDSSIAILSSLLNGNLSASEGGAVYGKDSDGIIINCTMNGNVATLYGGAVRIQGVSVLDIYNSIFWGNIVTGTQEAGDEIALSSDATANIFFSDVEGGPPAVFVETGGILNWGSTNININPQFMNPGYWLENEDVWIKGAYSLLPTSPCVDTGDNAVVAGIETDIVGNTRILGSIVDLGAYEYAGGLASSVINMKKMKVKAGKVRETEEGLFSDSFSITGYFGADVDSFENTDTVNITIGPWSETINRTDFVKMGKKSKYQYKGPPGGITAMRLDFDKGIFIIAGKNCNLTGLTAPVSVILTFGDFYGYTVVAESVINGNKQLPVQFLSSYTNFLRVDKIVCKSGEVTNIKSLTIQGAITALDDIDLTVTGLIIDWGTGQYEIAKENFSKKKNKYTAAISSSDTDPSSAKISIDFTKCAFKIVLKNTSITYQASPVWFGLECGSFDQGIEVTFEEK